MCATFLDISVCAAFAAPPEKADLRGVGQKEGEPGPGAIPRIKLVLLGDSVRTSQSSQSAQNHCLLQRACAKYMQPCSLTDYSVRFALDCLLDVCRVLESHALCCGTSGGSSTPIARSLLVLRS